MGIIRKTASISTLGLISFRSKKEKLRRAETAHRTALDELASEQAAHAAADERLTEAERRATRAELTALKEAKVARRRGEKLDAARSERGRRRRRRARHEARQRAKRGAATVRSTASDLVEAAQPLIE